MAKPTLPLFLGATALLSACASQGDFPSLAPRPIERELSGTPLPPCAREGAADGCVAGTTPAGGQAVARADDAALGARVATLLEQGRRGQAEFAAALPQANAAVRRAGAAQSESWIAAQQEISALEAARALSVDALAELDSLVLARAEERTTSTADRDRLFGAAEELRRLADTQQAELDRLNAAVSAP